MSKSISTEEILKGKFENLPKARPGIISIFLSSTFSGSNNNIFFFFSVIYSYIWLEN